jgi:2-amino-4-hydroxy-6-hydroxymethyldihydropteridine diphosphokinase
VSAPSTISRENPKQVPSTGVYISLGSNLSYLNLSPITLLECAIESLEAGGDKIIATSSFWVSDAWPAGTGAPNFVNAVCRVCPPDKDPAKLLKRLHEIEAKFGRLRDHQNQWSARTLDLDLLDYNGLDSGNCSFPNLPHPRIADRDFVLRPLLEVSANWVHPITQLWGSDLLDFLVKAGTTSNCKLVVR